MQNTIRVSVVHQAIHNAPQVKEQGLQIFNMHQGGFAFEFVARRQGYRPSIEDIESVPVHYPDGCVMPSLPPKDAVLIGSYPTSTKSEYVFNEPDEIIIHRLAEAGVSM
jgi:hypothetical protein